MEGLFLPVADPQHVYASRGTSKSRYVVLALSPCRDQLLRLHVASFCLGPQVGLSAATFALSHYQPHDLLPLTALGVVLALVTVQARGNLVAPTVTHVTYNLILLLALDGAV